LGIAEFYNFIIILKLYLRSATKKTRDKMAILAVENLIAGVENKKLPNCVNEEVYL
jgi:glyoxylate reductase